METLFSRVVGSEISKQNIDSSKPCSFDAEAQWTDFAAEECGACSPLFARLRGLALRLFYGFQGLEPYSWV